MRTAHEHRFAAADWPFADPEYVAAFTTVHVLEGQRPILLVTHDADDGAWQILCDTTNRTEDGRVECLGCLFERDRSIGELADLPLGWRARREAVGQPWTRELRPDDED